MRVPVEDKSYAESLRAGLEDAAASISGDTSELVKRIVLAWDPDFTKVTAEEEAKIEAAEKSGFVAEEEIDWDNLSQYSDG